MDNQEKLATLCTQDAKRKQKKKQKKQHKNSKWNNSKMVDIGICITISIKLKTKQCKKQMNNLTVTKIIKLTYHKITDEVFI
jgi:hypothetical protein